MEEEEIRKRGPHLLEKDVEIDSKEEKEEEQRKISLLY